ncbi:MAG: ABC transporter permease [Armatimonadetes bacterium]|nr:ABC transporter permease [Armatimonadota bacterium]
MKRSKFLFWTGVSFLGLLIVFALVGPTMRHNYLDAAGRPFMPPGSEYWLGTDEQGRDIFARLAYGARMSLLVGISVQLISLTIGTLVGVLGVFAPKCIREPLLRLTDGMFAFPDILLAILIIGVWSTGLIPIIVALSLTSWPAVARIVKTQVASLKDREFVVASRALGAPIGYTVRRHILPHLAGILAAVAMVDLAGTILAESALSFLGIGITPPTPSWGSMINDSRAYLNSNPMMLVWPCLVLSLAIFSLNFVGDELRAALDPKDR